MPPRLRTALATALLALPVVSFAQEFNPNNATLEVSGWFSGGITWSQVIGNLIGTFTGSVAAVCGAVFLLGALRYILGFYKEDQKSQGKTMMEFALIGLVVVLSAKAIFNTVLFFLYG